ncbi:hypothetical protein GCM10009680_57910 [Streptomyces yatensis]|uniref:Uncharacterized protein n=1 Tax=Streptomyces yatensis TaxID=155177 RepID=A0ABN2IPU4_9ACTN
MRPTVVREWPRHDERPFVRDLRPLKDDGHLQFATTANVWIHDGAVSWAALTTLPSGKARACQGRPRRPADELEPAWAWWLAEGRPTLDDFGMTVEPERQYVWCRDPATWSRWPLQAYSRASVSRQRHHCRGARHCVRS